MIAANGAMGVPLDLEIHEIHSQVIKDQEPHERTVRPGFAASF
jgi:hypothetical protein